MQVDTIRSALEVSWLKQEVDQLCAALPPWLVALQPEHADEMAKLIECICQNLGVADDDHVDPVVEHIRVGFEGVRPAAVDIVRQRYPPPLED